MSHITIVSSKYGPPRFSGGVERYADTIAKGLIGCGLSCEIVAFAEDLEPQSNVKCTYLRVPSIPLVRSLIFSWIGRQIWKRSNLINLQYTLLGFMMPKSRLICTVHTTAAGEARAIRQLDGFRRPLRYVSRILSIPFERYILQNTLKVIAISNNIAEELTSDYNISREKIVVIGNGVDTTAFTPTSTPKPNQPFRVLYVGRLTERKNVQLVLRALTACREPVEFHVVGEGPDSSALKLLCRNLKLHDRVTFLGARYGSELLLQYQAAHILVLPSKYEGMPLVALEAKATGLPVIAADFPGARDLVKDETGFIIDKSDDVMHLARLIDELAKSPQQVARMSARAREDAVIRYSWNQVFSSLSELFTDSALLAASQS